MKQAIRTVDDIQERLFHGTDIPSLMGIWTGDCFVPGWGQDGGPRGVSLTRCHVIAASVAADRQEAVHEDSFPQDFDVIPEGRCQGAVIELDGRALVAAGNRIRPFIWEARNGACDDEEQEERITHHVDGARRFIVAIHVRDEDLAWHAELWRPVDREVAASFERMRSLPIRVEPPVRSTEADLETVGPRA